MSNFKAEGKRLFNGKCAACHSIFKDATGPALAGVLERGPWKDTAILYQYVHNPEKLKKNLYVDSVKKMYGFNGVNHIVFPDLTGNEIATILGYINSKDRQRPSEIVE